MGRISVAAFRAKAGKERDLMAVLAQRVALMRRLGLVTDRPVINCRGRDGAVIHISEWASQEAIDRAHQMPEVHALWGQFAACSDYVSLTAVAEAQDAFACFEAVG